MGKRLKNRRNDIAAHFTQDVLRDMEGYSNGMIRGFIHLAIALSILYSEAREHDIEDMFLFIDMYFKSHDKKSIARNMYFRFYDLFYRASNPRCEGCMVTNE